MLDYLNKQCNRKVRRTNSLFICPAPTAIIAALMKAAGLSGNKIQVIDFGGSFGNLYFQCFPWLSGVSLDWQIIEQPHYVERARKERISDCLSFFPSFEQASQKPDVIIFSGVLQYLENWQEIVKRALELNPRFIIIDRLPVIAGKRDVICIQKTNRFYRIKSSYAMRLFNRRILNIFPQYRLLSEFDSWDKSIGGFHKVDFKGFIFERE